MKLPQIIMPVSNLYVFLHAEQKSCWSDYYSDLVLWMFLVEILSWKMAFPLKIIHGVLKSFKAISRIIPPIPYTLITLSFDAM
ncbi:hypothetical protein B7P43_G10152 [Cryptotermes secundus]|uniref:Uncharacterized protein n=1 Tax=Cryptotermes secundus TaxID=105785 RepID=A0A2J7Q8K8_9NEOP|nr:hypothetical protein B7P43_G10152 [Cryptotermes secundus]